MAQPVPTARSTAPASIRVLLVDDHQVVRMGLRTVLGFHPDITVVGEAGDTPSAIHAFRELRPDVVLMDLRIPGGGGEEATRAIRGENPSARVLVLTTYDAEEDIHRALEAGARGYLLKTAPNGALVEAIRRVAGGERVIPAEIEAKLASREAKPELTPREKEVLRLVATGHSNRDIAAKLGFTEHTSKAHLKQILVKMKANDRTQAATQAIQRGIVVLD
jgi:two-component system, NarL family, response regulator